MALPLTPHPDLLTIGAGDVFFDRFLAGAPQGELHFGDAEALEGTAEIEKLENRTNMRGSRAVRKEVITASKYTVTATMKEFSADNVALAMLAEVLALSQGAATATDANVFGGAPLKFDHWYRLQLNGVDVHYPSLTSLEQGGPALTEDIDYVFDRHTGMVKLLSTGGAAEAATTWSGSVPAIEGKQVHGFSTPRIEGRLRYRTAPDLLSGQQEEYVFHKCSVSPEGVMALIATEFRTQALQFVIEEDTSKPDGERFYTYRQLPAAPAEAGS